MGSGRGWAVWGVATLFFVYSVASSVAFGVLSSQVQAGLSLDSASLGVLSALLFVALGSGQLVAGTLIDRVAAGPLLATASATAAVGTLVFAVAPSAPLAGVGRVLGGLGMAFSFVGAVYLAREWFPAERYALMVGLAQTCANLTSAGLGVGLAVTAGTVGYRQVFLAMGLLGLGISLLALAVIRNRPSAKSAGPDARKVGGALQGLIRVCAIPRVWLSALYYALVFGVLLSYADLWNIPLQISYGNPLWRAAQVNAGIPVGVAVGSVMAGWLAGRPRGPSPPARAFPLGASAALAALLALPTLSPLAAGLLEVLFGFCLGGSVLAFAVVAPSCPAPLQGTAIGVVSTFGYVGGASLQSVVGAQLRADAHPDLANYVHVLWILPAALAAAALLALAFRTAPAVGPAKRTEAPLADR